MMNKAVLYALFFIVLGNSALCAQTFFRLSGDFSIREIMLYTEESDSVNTFLTRGHIDYDKNKKQAVYKVDFPESENWVLQDSVFYKLRNDTIISRYALPYAMRMLNFDILLSEYNYDFLFQKMGCSLLDVRQEEEAVYKLWEYPYWKQIGVFKYILVESKGQKTTGLAYLDENKHVVTRQYYKDYAIINGLNMPHIISQRIYTDSMTYVKKLILKNVTINNLKRDSVFRDDLEFLPIKPGADKGNIREGFNATQE